MSGLPAMKLSEGARDFIDEASINGLLAGKRPEAARVRDIIAKSMSKVALDTRETADLLLADSPGLIEEIFDAARELKKKSTVEAGPGGLVDSSRNKAPSRICIFLAGGIR